MSLVLDNSIKVCIRSHVFASKSSEKFIHVGNDSQNESGKVSVFPTKPVMFSPNSFKTIVVLYCFLCLKQIYVSKEIPSSFQGFIRLLFLVELKYKYGFLMREVYWKKWWCVVADVWVLWMFLPNHISVGLLCFKVGFWVLFKRY